jgi:hypothetical protein
LITSAVVVEAAGLVPLIWLSPHSGYLPLILVATAVEGIAPAPDPDEPLSTRPIRRRPPAMFRITHSVLYQKYLRNT